MIRGAINPVALAGNGVVRGGATPALREFVRATGIPVAETFMGKGLLPPDDPKALGSVGLQAGDYAMAGFEDADVVLAIGYDLVEHVAGALEPGQRQEDHLHRLAARRDRRVLRARGRAGRRHLPHAHAAGRGVPPRAPPGRLARACARWCTGRFDAAKDDDHFPVQPPARAVRDPQGARPRGHPGLRRRPAQAVDRADVPGLRAQHGADRQRPGGHGLRAARGRSPPSSCTPTATWSR